jgi:hypothetical protein
MVWCGGVVLTGGTDWAQRDRASGKPLTLTTASGRVITVKETKFDIFVCGEFILRDQNGHAQKDSEGCVMTEDFYAGRSVGRFHTSLLSQPSCRHSHVPLFDSEAHADA